MPVDVFAEVISDTEILVQWNPPLEDGGRLITHYQIEYDELSSFTGAQNSGPFGSISLSSSSIGSVSDVQLVSVKIDADGLLNKEAFLSISIILAGINFYESQYISPCNFYAYLPYHIITIAAILLFQLAIRRRRPSMSSIVTIHRYNSLTLSLSTSVLNQIIHIILRMHGNIGKMDGSIVQHQLEVDSIT